MKPSIDIPAAAPASPSTSFGDHVPAPLVRPRKDFPRVLARFDKALATGIPEGVAVQVGPAAATAPQIRAKLAPLLDLYRQLDALVKATQKLRLEIAAQTPPTYQYVKTVKAALANHLGAGNPLLADFGVPLPKRRLLTAAEKFLKSERGKRTRKTRGTLGSRQKQQLKFQGELRAQVVGPSAAAAGSGSVAAADGEAPD